MTQFVRSLSGGSQLQYESRLARGLTIHVVNWNNPTAFKGLGVPLTGVFRLGGSKIEIKRNQIKNLLELFKTLKSINPL